MDFKLETRQCSFSLPVFEHGHGIVPPTISKDRVPMLYLAERPTGPGSFFVEEAIKQSVVMEFPYSIDRTQGYRVFTRVWKDDAVAICFLEGFRQSDNAFLTGGLSKKVIMSLVPDGERWRATARSVELFPSVESWFAGELGESTFQGFHVEDNDRNKVGEIVRAHLEGSLSAAIASVASANASANNEIMIPEGRTIKAFTQGIIDSTLCGFRDNLYQQTLKLLYDGKTGNNCFVFVGGEPRFSD